MKNEIKGILVTFFREGTKGDYLEALNKAQNELLTVMEASKISSNGMLADSLPLSSGRIIETPQLDSFMDRILKALKR